MASLIKAGDKHAFREFYNLYATKIFSFSRSYLKSKSEAEELVQVVFVKLWEGRNEIKEYLSIRSYLYKITVNHIYNILKRRHFQVDQTDADPFSEKHDNTTLDQIYYSNLKESIDNLIEQLPEQRKIIFKLSRFEGLSHEQIATKLQLSVRTVESQVYKAIKILKENLKNDFL